MRNCHQSSHFIIKKVFPGLGPILTTGLTFWLTVTNFFFANKPSYKKYKSAKHRVIVSFFRRQRLIKGKRPQICAPLIWIGLSELDNSYAWWCFEMLWDALIRMVMLWEFFLCTYHCSNWYCEHRVCTWLVKKNKSGTANLWIMYFFAGLFKYV